MQDKTKTMGQIACEAYGVIEPWDKLDERQRDNWTRAGNAAFVMAAQSLPHTFRDYQTAAATTLLPAASNLSYLALGLAGEAGEVANKAKKILRDAGGEITPERAAALADELGDVLWYVAMLARILKLDLSRVADDNLAKLAARQKRQKLGGEGDQR